MTVIPGTSNGVLKLAGVAALGAVLTDVVVVLTEGLDKSFTVAAIPQHVGAIAVGGLLGWMYELLRELSKATTSSVREISSLTSKISYQDEALSMLLSCPRHNDVLTSLIAASMRDNFRNVPYVGVGEYLRFLSKAIEHSGGFQGIQRKPLRWFRDTPAAGYLEVLRDRKMARRTRIFVIEPDEIASMEEDLADQKVLDYYWEHGGDVDSYWISTEQFRKHCPRLRIPDDFGLYDGALLIAYDADHQVLTFNLVEDGSVERKIFESQRQLAERGVPAFKRISRDAATPETAAPDPTALGGGVTYRVGEAASPVAASLRLRACTITGPEGVRAERDRRTVAGRTRPLRCPARPTRHRLA